MSRSGIYLYVDGSALQSLLNDMQSKLTAAEFDKLMKRSFNEVGKRSKKIIRTAIQQEYHAPNAFVNSAIHSAIIGGGGGSVLCRIPLIGERGKIGGTFSASGGAYGWNPPAYSVNSAIVKSNISTMPALMSTYGGQPPFRNIGERTMSKNGKKKLKKPVVTKKGGTGSLTWTRAGKSRFPIMPVAGLAVPQMPLNRSAGEVERELFGLAERRVLHNFSYLFG